MQIRLAKTELMAALAACNSVKATDTSSRELLVRIVARTGLVSLDASNTEQHVTAVIETDGVSREGSVAVDRALLTAIMRRAQAGDIVIEMKGGQLRVADTAGSWLLSVSDVDALPVPPMAEACAGIVVPAAIWRRALGYALAAASREGARVALLGVSISCDDNGYELAGSDGRRAHRARIGMAVTDATRCRQIIAPSAWCRAVSSMSGSGDVHYQADANMACATMQSAGVTITISTRLIEGRYPDIKSVWPPANKIQASATVCVSDLDAALGAVAPAASEDGKRCTMSLTADDIGLDVRSDRARAERRVPALCKRAADVEIAYNIDYMTGAIDGADGDVCMRVISPQHPIELVFQPIVADNEPELSLAAIVMPLG